MSSLPLSTARVLSTIACLAGGALIASSQAEAKDVLLVEEHWELSVGGPDQARSAPQVTMTMSPTTDVEECFFIVTLNHWSFPNFAAGGIQVQRWLGDDCIEASYSEDQATLSSDGEVVRWVQRLRLDEGQLIFEIDSGSSATWGEFGGEDALKIVHPTTQSRLNSYRPAVSINQSGIAYAGNRVSSLVLKKLRWQTDDGDYHELVAPIDIATQIDP